MNSRPDGGAQGAATRRSRIRPFLGRLLAVLACLSAAGPDAFGRLKTDVLVLKSGDHISGEIKKLERGILRFSTDFAKTIDIEWEDVTRATSTYEFRIELTDGRELLGTLVEPSGPGRLRIAPGNGPAEEIDSLVIVRMYPLAASFWEGLDGSINAGFNTSKSSQVTQLSFSTSVYRRTPRLLTKLNASTTITTRQGDRTSQSELGISRNRLLRQRWFWGGGLKLQRNAEQGIDLRSLLALGAGRYLVQNNRTVVGLSGGLAANEEARTDGTPSTASLEAFIALEYNLFRFDSPKTDVTIQVVAYPSLSDTGRVRVDLSASVNQEIVKDFFFNLTLSDKYDNRPLSAEAEGNDYTVNASLGWSF